MSWRRRLLAIAIWVAASHVGRHDAAAQAGPAPVPNAQMEHVGQTFLFDYGGLVIRVRYLSAHKLEWEQIKGPAVGLKAEEEYGSSDIGRGVRFMWWQEKDTSVVTQVVDFEKRRVHTTWTSPDKTLAAFQGTVLPVAPPLGAQAPPDAAVLTALLDEFLAGASRNDVAVHDRFWAEDLVYTSATGRRKGKADILRELRSPSVPEPAGTTTIYTAEDVRVQMYGESAVVAFRLIANSRKGDEAEVAKYFNTGFFLKRQGTWKAVAWQATRIPRPEDEAKR